MTSALLVDFYAILRRKFRERFCRGSPVCVIIYIKHPNYSELINIIKDQMGIYLYIDHF